MLDFVPIEGDDPMQANRNRRRHPAHTIAFVVGVGIALSLLLRVAAQDKKSDSINDLIETVGGDLALESHAEFGNVFVAEVLEVLSEDYEKWGSEDDPNLVISYRVAIKQSLRGSATGEVKIEYLGADVSSPDTRGVGPLEVGERYLLSAGLPDRDGAYPVNAGLGTILLPNEKVESELVTILEPVIAASEERERRLIIELTAEAARDSE